MRKFLFILAIISLSDLALAEEWKMLVDFRGQWKFKLGDDKRWAGQKYDDSKWDEIFVPAYWENEGYPGYDGLAWYRKHFHVSAELRNKVMYIDVGAVDDVSDVYVNGHFVSFTGSFPPHFITAYSIDQKFQIPAEFLNFSGDNVIAVRVYDDQQGGGIAKGKPGIFEMEDYLYPDFPITDGWKFHPGDEKEWARPETDDSQWRDFVVPMYWEVQGFKGYDGFGWYRVRFTIPDKFRDQDLILLVGKVDDVDETYLNGVRIGYTGGTHVKGDEYRKLRAYTVPSSRMKLGEENVLAVRVYDNFLGGGIYDGPVGFVTRERYKEWARTHTVKENNRWDFWDLFK